MAKNSKKGSGKRPKLSRAAIKKIREIPASKLSDRVIVRRALRLYESLLEGRVKVVHLRQRTKKK